VGQSIKHYSEHDVDSWLWHYGSAASLLYLSAFVASSVIPVVQSGRANSDCYTAYTTSELVLELELDKFIW
jgi:hypothetical protein